MSIFSEIGEVVTLMSCSDYYKQYSVSDIERYVSAPIAASRAAMFYDEDGDIAGFVTHAFLRPKIEKAFIEGTHKMELKDWIAEPSDGQLWIIDFIAPMGGADQITKWHRRQLANEYDDHFKVSFVRRKNDMPPRVGSIPIRSVRLH